MALLHLNVFHWHLTDEPGWRIEIKKYPKLTEIGAVGNWHDAQAAPQFYTQDDIREIVAYAAERQIMVVPEYARTCHSGLPRLSRSIGRRRRTLEAFHIPSLQRRNLSFYQRCTR